MAKDHTSHITVTYHDGGAEVARTYAINDDTMRAARAWCGQQRNPTASLLQAWLVENRCQLDSCDGPAIISRFDNSLTVEEYYRDGKKHREDGPAVIERSANGSAEIYWHHGEVDRGDGPAVVRRFANGRVWEEYYARGKLHRDNGPAVTIRDTDGSTVEKYFRNGKEDRKEGPAYVRHFADGAAVEIYYRDGVFVKRDDLGVVSDIPGVTLRPPASNGPRPPTPA